jgi:hypothetical protein
MASDIDVMCIVLWSGEVPSIMYTLGSIVKSTHLKEIYRPQMNLHNRSQGIHYRRDFFHFIKQYTSHRCHLPLEIFKWIFFLWEVTIINEDKSLKTLPFENSYFKTPILHPRGGKGIQKTFMQQTQFLHWIRVGLLSLFLLFIISWNGGLWARNGERSISSTIVAE